MVFGKYTIRAKELSDEELGPYHAFISIGGKDMVEIIANNDCYCIHYPNGGVKKNKHVVDELTSMMPKNLLAEPDCPVSPISWLIILLGEWLRAEMLAEEAYKEHPGDDTFIVALSHSELPIDFWALPRLSYTDAEIRDDIMTNTCQMSRKCAGAVLLSSRALRASCSHRGHSRLLQGNARRPASNWGPDMSGGRNMATIPLIQI